MTSDVFVGHGRRTCQLPCVGLCDFLSVVNSDHNSKRLCFRDNQLSFICTDWQTDGTQ